MYLSSKCFPVVTIFCCIIKPQAQALDSANQQLEYCGIFQPFGSSYTNDSLKVTDQPKTVANSDDQSIASPEKENSLSLHSDDDSSSQHNVLYDQLPSPRSFKPSLSFSGKKTKYMWTSGHLRVLCDVLEFAWNIVENWKRFLN